MCPVPHTSVLLGHSSQTFPLCRKGKVHRATVEKPHGSHTWKICSEKCISDTEKALTLCVGILILSRRGSGKHRKMGIVCLTFHIEVHATGVEWDNKTGRCPLRTQTEVFRVGSRGEGSQLRPVIHVISRVWKHR